MKEKLWTKDFIMVTCLMFFTFISFFLMITAINEYSITVYGVGQNKAWLASSLFTAGCLLARAFIGKYMEVWGRAKCLYTSLVIFLIIMASYLLDISWGIFLVLRTIHGVAFGVCSTITPALSMDIIPKHRRGEGTAYFTLSNTFATAIGPFLGIYITQNQDPQMMFVWCTGFTIIACIVALILNVPRGSITKEQLEESKKLSLSNLFEKNAIPASVVVMLIAICYGAITTYINTYTGELGLSRTAGYFFIVYAVFILISRPTAGKYMDRKGDNFIAYPAMVIFIVCLVLLAFTTRPWMLLLSAALMGVGYGNAVSTTQTIAAKESPAHRVGLATSTYFFGVDLGAFTGPLIVGNLVDFLGFRGIYLLMAGVMVFAIFIYYQLHGKKQKGRKGAFFDEL